MSVHDSTPSFILARLSGTWLVLGHPWSRQVFSINGHTFHKEPEELEQLGQSVTNTPMAEETPLGEHYLAGRGVM